MTMINCLLIDDNPIDLLVNQHVVKKVIPEVEVVQKKSAVEALDYLRNSENKLPDFILLDIKMPLLDGFGFLEEFKKDLANRQTGVRIFILSSSIDPEDLRRAKEEELVVAFVQKPLRAENLEVFFLEN